MEKLLIGITPDLVFQIINTIILFLVLKHILFKPVLGIIEARENDIQDNLAKGELAKNQGIALKREYEEKDNHCKRGRSRNNKASLRAKKKSDEIISNPKDEATHIKEKAN